MSDDEKRARQLNTLSGISIAALLITTAWGNATGMFLVAAILLVGMLALTERPRTKVLTAATVCGGVAFLLAVLIQQL